MELVNCLEQSMAKKLQWQPLDRSLGSFGIALLRREGEFRKVLIYLSISLWGWGGLGAYPRNLTVVRNEFMIIVFNVYCNTCASSWAWKIFSKLMMTILSMENCCIPFKWQQTIMEVWRSFSFKLYVISLVIISLFNFLRYILASLDMCKFMIFGNLAHSSLPLPFPLLKYLEGSLTQCPSGERSSLKTHFKGYD